METRPIDADDVVAVYDDMGSQQDSSDAGPSIHYGFYDADHDDRAAAVENMNRVLSEAVDVGPDDRVLVLGCGAGDESVWLARQRGATVVGVDVSDRQLDRARKYATDRGVTDSVTFRNVDFHDLAEFDAGSFDVVWALEAFCHSGDDCGVLEQARRVLHDGESDGPSASNSAGGRLVVGDLFQLPRELSKAEQTQLRSANDALGARVDPIDEFVEHTHDLGFENVDVRDVTESIMPSSRQRGLYGRLAYRPYQLLQRLGLASQTRVDVLRGSGQLHKLVQSGALGYYHVTAEC